MFVWNLSSHKLYFLIVIPILKYNLNKKFKNIFVSCYLLFPNYSVVWTIFPTFPKFVFFPAFHTKIPPPPPPLYTLLIPSKIITHCTINTIMIYITFARQWLTSQPLYLGPCERGELDARGKHRRQQLRAVHESRALRGRNTGARRGPHRRVMSHREQLQEVKQAIYSLAK